MRKVLLSFLLLFFTGCPNIQDQIGQGDEISFQVPIFTYANEYVLTAKGPWCEWAPGAHVCRLHPPGDFVEVTGQFEPLKLVRKIQNGQVLTSTVVSGKVVRYDPAKDECAKIVAPGFSCSPNFVLKADLRPSDPLYGSLWGLKRASFPKLWDVATGNNTVVAVIDSGVAHHPDLDSQVLWDKAYNAITGGADVTDENGHGTHVAGTIGAAWNSYGVAGACPSCKILPIKFIGADGSGSLFAAVKAIQYATAQRAKVANNSWGGGGFSQPMYDAIRGFTNFGGLFVAAAGNEGVNNGLVPHYPCDYDIPGVISVGAIDSTGALASFSNFGKKAVDIAAPGVGILSTWPGAAPNDTRSLSGTSMATPHVAGLAGLLYGLHPNESPTQIAERIFRRAKKNAHLRGKVAKRRELQAVIKSN